MKPRVVFYCLIVSILLPASVPVFALPPDSTRRFALVVGANDGGSGRPELKYAVSDAHIMSHILQKIGGVFPIDCILLVEPDRESFFGKFQSLQRKIRQAQGSAKKTEMVFYYSGHSDEEAVLLGRERVTYKEIKKSIEKIPSEVRIAILDSCSSGAFTRLKGGKMRPPFLLDDANDMKGFAYLTSSSSDEASQESDRLKSSFFTHYLVSGLRGAADMSQDGRVTLNEAYQYAYHETLAKTEKTMGGPQHPNYNIQMTGTGDVVMTDIRNSSAIMSLDKTVHGRIFILDQQDHIVLEIRKAAGRVTQIGLEAGTYLISNERNHGLYEIRIELKLGQEFLLSQDRFAEIEREPTRARGDKKPASGKFEEDGYKIVPWEFILMPNSKAYGQTIHYCVLGLLGTCSAKLEGFALSLGPNFIKEDSRGAQFSAFGNFVGHKIEGIQVASLINVCEGDVRGVQSTGLMNIVKGTMDGVQSGGILGISKGDVRGVQLGSIFTLTGGNITGTQIGGIFSFSGGNLIGAQVSGIFSYAGGDIQGMQLSLVNIAGDCDGAQIGLVNIAKEQRGIPVGLLNLAENGSIDLVGWKDSLTAFNLGVKFRAGYFYSLFSTSKKSLNSSFGDGWGAGFHYGGHIPLDPFYLEVDLGYAVTNNQPTDRYDESDLQMVQARLMAGVIRRKRFSLFVGTGAAYICRGRCIDTNAEEDGLGLRDLEWEPFYLVGASFSF
ncbi:caspase family protein [bacterium]|nr:caspase family protein [bacterium]